MKDNRKEGLEQFKIKQHKISEFNTTEGHI
jgi:hypothetical protein